MSVSSGFCKPAKEPVAARQIKRRPQVVSRNVAGAPFKRRQLLVIGIQQCSCWIHWFLVS